MNSDFRSNGMLVDPAVATEDATKAADKSGQ